MGCFLACFGGAKDRKQRRPNKKPIPTNNPVNRNYQPSQTCSSSPQKPIIEEVAAGGASVPELREKEEQASSIISCRKKVTFDLNVKKYENVAFDGDINDVLEAGEGKAEAEDETKGMVSPAMNYRYQNCESSDDECIEEVDDDDDDDDDGEFDDGDFDDDVAAMEAEEESYDSLFSLPMDMERQHRNSEEVTSRVATATSVSANGGARDRSQYVHSVLNPVENLSQWKEVKARVLPSKGPNRENSNAELESKLKGWNKENSGSKLETKVTGFSPEPNFKANRPQEQGTKQEISVDASLSTWLVSSENSPKGNDSHRSNSMVSREEQPILGALTVEDLKQAASVTSSPRRSPSRNPDDIPILGTVGSYWNSRAVH